MVTILCTVKAGARRDGIEELPSGEFSIRIRARAVEGKANAAIISYLAGVLGLRQRDITIERGHTSRRKRISIDVSEAKWKDFRSLLSEK